jgi:preprotein translocase subunit SecA
VVTKMMKAQIRQDTGDEQLEQMEADKLARHLDELSQAVARHGGENQPASSPGLPAPPAVLKEEPCPCGSGKAFSKCHGSELDLDEASP